MLSMNDALQPMGMALEAGGSGGGGAASGAWTLRFDDGSSCAYKDGMVVRSRGGGDAGRGRAVLEAYSGAPVPPGVLPPAPGGMAVPAAPQQGPPRAAAGPQQARAAPPARMTGVAGAGAPSWSAAPLVPVARRHELETRLAPPATYRPDLQQQPAQQQHHAPRASNPEAVARQLAAAAAQAGMHPDGDDLDDDDACVICLANARDTVLVPCGHSVLCLACCGDVKAGSNQCPVCREEIIEAVHVGA